MKLRPAFTTIAKIHPVAILFLVITATLIVYQPLPEFDFINLDDDVYTYNNTYTQEGLTKESINWAWTKFGSPYYMPLTRISYLLDVEVFGLDPRGFHIGNLVLHLVNIILIFVFASVLLRSAWSAGFVSALFALHPQHIEAVAWIAQRKELLAATFGLVSLVLYLKYIKTNSIGAPGGPGINRLCYYLSILLFLFSLLSKPTWVMFPALLILIDFVTLDEHSGIGINQLLKEKVFYFIVSLVYVLIHLYAVSDKGDHVINSAQSLSLLQRTLNSPAIVVDYLLKGLLPIDATPYLPYPAEPLPTSEITIALGVLLLTLILVSLVSLRSRLFFAGTLWFLIALLPVIGILGTGESILVGDRWSYMPHIGLFLAMGAALNYFHLRLPNFKPALILLACGYLLCSAIYAQINLAHWRNSDEYWNWTISRTENNHYAHLKLGEFYEQQGMRNEAELQFLTAHELNSREYLYILRLANLLSVSDVPKAFHYYRKLLDTAPSSLIFNMGVMFLVNQHAEKAMPFFNKNVLLEKTKSTPTVDYYLSRIYLAHLSARKGESNSAADDLMQILEELPYDRGENCKFVTRELGKIETLTGYSKTSDLILTACNGPTAQKPVE